MVNKILRIGIVAIGLIAAAPTVSADTYMFVQGVNGDATDPARKNWIRVSSVEWGVHNNTTIGTATGGAGAGKSTGKELKLKIPTGPWSQHLLNNLLRGTHYPQIIIDHINPDGRLAWRATLQTLFLTDFQSGPGGKTLAEDAITGVYGGFRAEFYTVLPDGRVVASPVGWNFITNVPL